MDIFPIQELTDTEKHLLADALAVPVVQKYLQMLAYNIGRDIVVAIPSPIEPEESWLRKEIYLKGQLSTIQSLLDIQPLPKQ